MKQRVITGLLFLIVMLAFCAGFYFVPFVAVILALIVGSVSTYEIIKALKSGGYKPSYILMIIGEVIGLLVLLSGWFFDLGIFLTSTLFMMILLMYCLGMAIFPQIAKPEAKLKDSVTSVAAMLYVAFPMYCLCAMALFFEHGWLYLIVGLFASWVSDTFAYFTGVLLGKHKIVPHISPKKTWEGCIGGAVFCGLFMALYFGFIVYMIDDIKIGRILFMAIMFLFGLIISAMSQIGDWLASAIKRSVDIKDYGKFLPGHGGMLDRFDSVFFTLPIALCIAILSMYI
ncbi:MAG: phosphatidate cytidylyltransferase [Clostridiales bacterium]|nr:phosphatidate cytidylyltransferase [Clostridiales bacterium]